MLSCFSMLTDSPARSSSLLSLQWMPTLYVVLAICFTSRLVGFHTLRGDWLLPDCSGTAIVTEEHGLTQGYGQLPKSRREARVCFKTAILCAKRRNGRIGFMKRHEISEKQWNRIKLLFPPERKAQGGRPGKSNRKCSTQCYIG